MTSPITLSRESVGFEFDPFETDIDRARSTLCAIASGSVFSEPLDRPLLDPDGSVHHPVLPVNDAVLGRNLRATKVGYEPFPEGKPFIAGWERGVWMGGRFAGRKPLPAKGRWTLLPSIAGVYFKAKDPDKADSQDLTVFDFAGRYEIDGEIVRRFEMRCGIRGLISDADPIPKPKKVVPRDAGGKETTPDFTVPYRPVGTNGSTWEEGSRDRNPLHKSDEYARDKGFPARIVYGPLQTAACLRAAVITCADGNWDAIEEFEIGAFKLPLLFDEAHEARIWRTEDRTLAMQLVATRADGKQKVCLDDIRVVLAA